MYKTQTKVREDFFVESKIDNVIYVASIDRKNGTSPMGILNVALSSCIIMCIRGYYIKNKIKDVNIEITNEYEENRYNVLAEINRKIDENEEKAIREYIKEKCNVSKMLKESIEINILIKGVD